jgi:hypothetical protein
MQLGPVASVTVGACACAAVVAVAFGACTVFDGVTVSDADADAGCSAGSTTAYLTVAQAARACAFIADCDQPAGSGQFELDIETSIGVVTSQSSYAYCMNALAGTVPPDRPGLQAQQQTFQCMAAASDCASAHACVAVESIEQANDPRCPDGGPPSTVDAAIYCANGNNDIVDCQQGVVEHCKAAAFASGQGTCQIEPDDSGYYACGTSTPPPCTALLSSCDLTTNLLTVCEPGSAINAYFDCTAFGDLCGNAPTDGGAGTTSDSGDAAAAPPAGVCVTAGVDMPCDPVTYRDGCLDAAIATCTFVAQISLTNCAALGKDCSHTNGQPFCAGPSDECSPYSLGIGECSGNSLSLCIDGHRTSVDCTCAGMTCGGDGGQGQRCVGP